MSTSDSKREPCPERLIDDAGGAFAMGLVGGSMLHYAKGFYNSPNGLRHAGAAQAVRMNAPRIGGGWAAWCILFSSFDCAMVYARQKEDPWNSIFAGSATCGLLAVRRGAFAFGRNALLGGCVLTLIEGIGIMFNRMYTQEPTPAYLGQDVGPRSSPVGFPGMPQTPPGQINEIPVPDSGRFGGFFGKKKEEKAPTGGGDPKSEMPESFKTPTGPVPSFDF